MDPRGSSPSQPELIASADWPGTPCTIILAAEATRQGEINTVKVNKETN